MLPRSKVSLADLVALAHSKQTEQRGVLFENMADLFVAEESKLSDRERATIRGILDRLMHEVEMEVRRAVAERLAGIPSAPAELVSLLANDHIEIARPILLRSEALRDPDLIGIVRSRGKEHSLAVSMRAGLSPDVTDALVETGDEDVIARLLENDDAELSRRAVDYLVAEAERVGRFQEPLVRRSDLPPDLAARMYWWVSAALRQYLLKTIAASELDIDDMVEDTTENLAQLASTPGDGAIDRAAAELVARLAERNELSPVTLIRFLRSGRINAFIAGLSRHARLGAAAVRQILYEEGGESLAIVCKANAWSRSHFGEAFLLSRRFSKERVVPPDVLEETLRFFDDLSADTALSMLRFWRRDRRYLEAIDRLAPAGAAGGPTVFSNAAAGG